MFEIDILNCKSKKRKPLYKAATEYFAYSLMPRVKNMYLDVCLENNLDADAFCTQIEDKYFVIEISRRLPFNEQLKSIAHEMVHCKQFYYKKLQYKQNKIYWLNKEYNYDSLSRTNLTESQYHMYLNLPWEIEAYAMETMLYDNFILKYEREMR
jgi:hypothetical protein